MATKIYKQIDDVVARVIAGEKLIVPVRGNLADMQNIFTVDEVGSFIWDSINGKRSMEDIVALISDEFDVAESEAAADLREFLESLKKAGLIVEV
ncbi:MAG: PqqD family protein [Desulfobacteraceae bacterium]|jgi:hypothetical protein